MGTHNRQFHPAQDKAELRVHTRLKLFDILMSAEGADADEVAKKAKEISNQFTDDYE